MYKIDRRGGVQKSYTRTDPYIVGYYYHFEYNKFSYLMFKSLFI